MSGETSSSSSLANKDERKICANGSCVQTDAIEAKLDSGNIDEAEADLRQGLSLDSEVFVSANLFWLIFKHVRPLAFDMIV